MSKISRNVEFKLGIKKKKQKQYYWLIKILVVNKNSS